MSDCTCQEPGFCERRGKQLTVREWELCSDNCPPEQPCPQEVREALLAAMDGRHVQELPVKISFAQRAARFVLAMRDEAAWRAGGGAGPTDEERAARRSACDACEHRDPEVDGCLKCGCYLEAGLLPPRPLGKLSASTQKCPIDKWGYAGGYSPPQSKRCCG